MLSDSNPEIPVLPFWTAAILKFVVCRRRAFLVVSIELGDLENSQLYFEISFLSVYNAEIPVFPVWMATILKFVRCLMSYKDTNVDCKRNIRNNSIDFNLSVLPSLTREI